MNLGKLAKAGICLFALTAGAVRAGEPGTLLDAPPQRAPSNSTVDAVHFGETHRCSLEVAEQSLQTRFTITDKDILQTGEVAVGSGHSLWFRAYGNPFGPVAVFLHGGPGLGTTLPDHIEQFNPEIWKIVVIDQRGCGRSLPHFTDFTELRDFVTTDNNPIRLVHDINQVLRKGLEIKGDTPLTLVGSSWGSTLALLYAMRFPTRVRALVLRGLFLGRQSDIDWVYRGGAARAGHLPEAWDQFVEPLQLAGSEDPLEETARIILEGGEQEALAAIERAMRLEYSLAHGKVLEKFGDEYVWERVTRFVITMHYIRNRMFFKTPNWLLEQIALKNGVSPEFQRIPITVVHGREELLCPVDGVEALQRAKANVKVRWVEGRGHLMNDSHMLHALQEEIQATRPSFVPEALVVGGIWLNRNQPEVLVEGTPVQLSFGAYFLLKKLMEEHNKHKRHRNVSQRAVLEAIQYSGPIEAASAHLTVLVEELQGALGSHGHRIEIDRTNNGHANGQGTLYRIRD